MPNTSQENQLCTCKLTLNAELPPGVLFFQKDGYANFMQKGSTKLDLARS